ncbi:sensor histidine kinase [Massilia sp. DWR3-1-1]|uniref:sensor histidine kinase n=1 Tax=Massilia sp. DWR3-1-1 TaxID=2804559 RepID=UPI003CEF075A
MNHVRLRALVAAVLVASLVPVAATVLGAWPAAQAPQPLLSLAIAGLALAAFGVHCLLVRHLGAADALARAHARLYSEQAARSGAEQALDELQASVQHQQEQARASERTRIARDIHDDLGQHLLALKIELQLACQAEGAGQAPCPATLARLAGQVDQSIGALRVVINNLRPAALHLGLQAAMEQQLREFSRLSGIGYELVAQAPPPGGAPNDALDTTVLRILRESLANVVRHAQASAVRVTFRHGEKDVTLEIRDNGIGFAAQPVKAAAGAAGVGLAGIAERVTAAGGSFAVDSAPGRGTLLSMSFPLFQS